MFELVGSLFEAMLTLIFVTVLALNLLISVLVKACIELVTILSRKGYSLWRRYILNAKTVVVTTRQVIDKE